MSVPHLNPGMTGSHKSTAGACWEVGRRVKGWQQESEDPSENPSLGKAGHGQHTLVLLRGAGRWEETAGQQA